MNIYDISMGRGKTSVLIPSTILYDIIINDIKYTYLILPDHLLNENYDKISKITNTYKFVNVKKIIRSNVSITNLGDIFSTN
jgi:hypothetical protein